MSANPDNPEELVFHHSDPVKKPFHVNKVMSVVSMSEHNSLRLKADWDEDERKQLLRFVLLCIYFCVHFANV